MFILVIGLFLSAGLYVYLGFQNKIVTVSDGRGGTTQMRSGEKEWKTRPAQLAALVVLVLIITLSANFLGSRRSFLESALSVITAPFEKGAAKVARRLESLYDQMYKYDTLKAENEELRRRVAELEDQARGYAAAISENDRLRTLLGLVSLKPDLELCSAPITAWTASNWACSFTISISSSMH